MLKNCTPEELSYLATSFAVAVSKGLDVHSLRVMCSFFTNVVATLNLIINQQILVEKSFRPPGGPPSGRPVPGKLPPE